MNDSPFPRIFRLIAKSGLFFSLFLNAYNSNALPLFDQDNTGTITRYEAEDAALTGVSIAKSLAGYSGTGYMDAGSFDADGDKITFTVNVATTASYPLIIRFVNSCGACEKAQNISVNGGSAKSTIFLGTSTTWQDLNAGDVDLKAGSNTITISKSWGWTSIDYIGIGENDTSAPTAPTNLKASNITQTSYSLTWTASTDNVGVSGYDVFQKNTLISSTSSTGVSISNLNCNTEYPEISVKAKDKAGNVSSASEIILVKTSPCVSYSLKVNGGIGSGSFGSGKLIDITADDAPKGKTFDKWIGSNAVTNPGLAMTTVLMPESDVEITATYKDIDTTPLLDASATTETVALWNYLKSVYGQKMLTGCWTETQFGGNDNVEKCAGETPAIWGQDMNSWYSNRTDQNWINTWNSNIQGFKAAHKRGQILQLNWHWQMPSSKVNGVYTRDAWGKNSAGVSQMMTAQQWSDMVTPGTALYDAMIEDIDYHVVNFLKKIVDDKGVPIPIIFRPLHEIDGGWFWWTCTTDPTKTAKLYKILQDRIINFQGCHNLIWVYNPGVICNGVSWPPYQASENARRKAFYPGDAFCDITGIDLYDFDPAVRGTYSSTGKRYRDAWNMMKALSPTKMIALCEAEGMPDVQKSFTDPNYAPWLYCLPWYSINYTDPTAGATRDLCEWNKIQFKSAYVINAGDFSITSAENHSVEEQSEINIFPNPVNGKLNLVMKEKAVKIELFDMNGRIMKSQNANSTIEIIDLSGFESGAYILKATLKNGNSYSTKILKQ
jgi:mannan endo-1,4-beta-mannosidase